MNRYLDFLLVSVFYPCSVLSKNPKKLEFFRCIAYNSKGKAETVGHVEVASIIQIDAPQIVQPLVENIDGIEVLFLC